jgi:hypothetical protein
MPGTKASGNQPSAISAVSLTLLSLPVPSQMEDRLERLADPHRALSLVGERDLLALVGQSFLAGEDLAHNRDVIPNAPIGLAPGLAVPAFDDLGPAHAEPGDEAIAAGQGIDGRRLHGRHRRA